MKEIIEIIDTLKFGDEIEITICDCGTGVAKFLAKIDNKIEIEVDKETWSTCYPCQSLVTNTLSLRIEDIYAIERR